MVSTLTLVQNLLFLLVVRKTGAFLARDEAKSTRYTHPSPTFSSRLFLPASQSVEFVPSSVHLENVCLQYPVTLARRLFSSVPRRDYAVDHVTLSLTPCEVVLLQGASSSGKSALMKLILGQEQPTEGTVTIKSESEGKIAAIPVYLADKPPIDNTNTVQQILQQAAQKGANLGELGADFVLQLMLIQSICQCIGIDEAVLSQKPAHLSPSQNYRIRLAEACLKSSVPVDTYYATLLQGQILQIPAPILLLDEWMDFETRDSSQKVEESILQLLKETGAVVICATHKPDLWRELARATPYTRQITMSAGRILPNMLL